MYVAIKTLDKLHKCESFDLLRAKFELYEKTLLFEWLDKYHGINESDPLQYRLEKLEELLENAERIGLIEVVNGGSWKKNFMVSVKGRNFLKFSYFVQYSLKEFDSWMAIILAFISGVLATYVGSLLI